MITASGYPIVLPRESESVLLGAAILGSVAAKKYSSLIEAMKALNAAGQVVLQWCTIEHIELPCWKQTGLI